jgi:sigma-E factor negative regulatory protein RseB
MSAMLRRSSVGVSLACVISIAQAQDARLWLDRMNAALEQLDYVGTFVHVHGDSVETLHITHRNRGGIVSERIVSNDGVGREIIREGEQVRCVLPDRRVVLLEERRDANPLFSTAPNYSQKLEESYRFKTYNTDRVATRETQIIVITPKDEYRYGYMLWLDKDTAMPLKSQLREGNRTVEEILFSDIEFPDTIPDAALQPAIATDGFKVLLSGNDDDGTTASLPWQVGQLPGGFQLTASTYKPIAGAQYPVGHLVYSDGLATVSVFIEDPKSDAEVTDGFSAVGSTNAFSLTLGGRKVTAVGEVPRRTVETIATSLRPQ